MWIYIVITYLILHYTTLIFILDGSYVWGMWILLRDGQIKSLFFGLVPYSIWVLSQRLLMIVEDLCIIGGGGGRRRLSELEQELKDGKIPLAIVVGHPRSGTTSVHGALSRHHRCFTGRSYDVGFPSLTAKYLLSGLASMLDYAYLLVSGHRDVANHKFGFDEKMEEPFLLLHDFYGPAIYIMLFPHLGTDVAFFQHASNFTRKNYDFVTKCMARILYHHNGKKNGNNSDSNNDNKELYIACPLAFTKSPQDILDYYPNSKMIVCVRDPIPVLPSLTDLFQSLSQEGYTAKFKGRMHLFFDNFSVLVFAALAKFTTNSYKDRVYWLDFEDWKQNGPQELELLWDYLGLPADNAQVAGEKKERHVNRKESFDVIPPEKIKRELYQYYQTMKRACETQKKKKKLSQY